MYGTMMIVLEKEPANVEDIVSYLMNKYPEKWDAYEFGLRIAPGFYTFALILKNEEETNYAKFKDIDWDKTTKEKFFGLPVFATFVVIWKNEEWYEYEDLTEDETKYIYDKKMKREPKEVWESKYKGRFLDKIKPNNFVIILEYHN